MSFSGLDIALSALRAQQLAMNVTGNNIANAATEGYHRREAVLVPSSAVRNTGTILGNPQIGTGVLVQTIRRVQNTYIENQIRLQNQELGMWDYRNESLKQIEAVLGEPGDLGLSATLDKFWNSWEELASTPDSLTAKISVVQAGTSVCDRIKSLYNNFRQLQARVDIALVDNAGEINRLAHEIANINKEITAGSDSVSQPNDMLDRREQLIGQLSKLVPIQVSGSGGLSLMVSVSGKNLIQGGHVTEVALGNSPTGWTGLVWTDDGTDFVANGGQVKAQITIRDDILGGHIADLDSIAQTIISRVNELHTTGTLPDGTACGSFFTPGGDASNISIEASLVNSRGAGVGVGITGTEGDNSLALAMSDVRGDILINGQTIGGAYAGLVATIGTQAREAIAQTGVHNLSVQQLETQRESVSGVSIDEEMVNMVKFQQAYNAAARIMLVLDSMLDTLINKTGVG